MFDPFNDAWPFEDQAPLSSRLPSLVSIMAGLTPSEADAASHDGAILVLAGAGTEKTRTLTAGVALPTVELVIALSRILCVTFINKAAAEMKQRSRKAEELMQVSRSIMGFCSQPQNGGSDHTI